ncbi:hypothetical protein ACET3Z_017213 [Daucus carota]
MNADTAIAVASEMVEELDLTDQDSCSGTEWAPHLDWDFQSCPTRSLQVDGWTDVDEQSPVSCQSGVDIKDDVSSEKQDGGELDNIMKNQECHSAYHSHSPPDSPSDNRAHVLLENQSLNDINLGDDKLIAERRECLLLEQQRELDELKKKHKQIASDLLKELPLETHKRIGSRCLPRTLLQFLQESAMTIFTDYHLHETETANEPKPVALVSKGLGKLRLQHMLELVICNQVHMQNAKQ